MYSCRWIVQTSCVELLLNPVSKNSSEENTHIRCNKEQIAAEFSFVVTELHVAGQIRLSIGHEQEIRECGTALAANPERPEEDNIKARDGESKDGVESPTDQVDQLERSRNPWILKRHLLQTGEREDVTKVVGQLEHCILMIEDVGRCDRLRNTTCLERRVRLAILLHLLDEFGLHLV